MQRRVQGTPHAAHLQVIHADVMKVGSIPAHYWRLPQPSFPFFFVLLVCSTMLELKQHRRTVVGSTLACYMAALALMCSFLLSLCAAGMMIAAGMPSLPLLSAPSSHHLCGGGGKREGGRGEGGSESCLSSDQPIAWGLRLLAACQGFWWQPARIWGARSVRSA